jgi:diguanylate cyclase (GGDEF)-like protein
MNILRSFVIKQVLLTLMQIGVLMALVIASFSAYLVIAHQEKTQVVEQLLANNVSHDPKLLARQLRKAYDFQALNIGQLDGSILYTYISPDAPATISYPLFEAIDTLPINQQISNKDLNIKLSFEINLNNELVLLDQLLGVIVSTTLVLALFNLLMVKLGLGGVFERVSDNIAKNIELYANPSQRKKKKNVDWSQIPPKFGSVVDAVKKLGVFVDEQMKEFKSSAELIKTEALKDELTGLPNRIRFVQFFDELLKSKTSIKFGSLAVVRCSQLQEVNHAQGYQEGDKYVKDVVDIITHSAGSYDKPGVYRLNGSDFAVVLPSKTLKEAEAFAQSLQSKFNEYQRIAQLDSVAYTGLINYKPGKPLGEILALTDTAISIAQTKQTNAWHSQNESDILDNASASYGNQNWRQVIEDVIENNRVALMYQTIQPCNRNTKAYAEVLTRFKTGEDQVLPTASFLAMAEKLDKIVEVDRMIIEATLAIIKEKSLVEQSFGLNITPKTVHDEQFLIWLERRLQKDPQIAARLVFEVSEFGLQQNVKASKKFIDLIHRCGARITVERFGVGLTSFKFFRDLKPDFIKMDGTYTRGIDEDKNNQYFMRMMVDLAHRIGVSVFAEGVETQNEKHVLEKLFIDGTQGYFIGKPAPF